MMVEKRSVKIESYKGNLRLRWTYEGKRRCLSLGMYDTPLARNVAESRANQIEADIVTGNYDPILAKYKGESAADVSSKLTCSELFQRFTKYNSSSIDGRTMEKYKAIAVKINKRLSNYNADVDSKVAEEFRVWLSASLSARSQKEYLGTIATCWDWGVKGQLVSENPWKDIVKLVKVPPKQKPKPFSSNEIRAILEGFSKNRYYRHYTDFVAFLLGSGCRISEAIGLRWGHLSDDCTKVWIGESVSRGVRKSSKVPFQSKTH